MNSTKASGKQSLDRWSIHVSSSSEVIILEYIRQLASVRKQKLSHLFFRTIDKRHFLGGRKRLLLPYDHRSHRPRKRNNLSQSQAINEGPVYNVEENERKREAHPWALVDPGGDLLGGHGGPGVLLGRRIVGALAAVVRLLVARHQLVEALCRDCWQVHRRWEALKEEKRVSGVCSSVFDWYRASTGRGINLECAGIDRMRSSSSIK